MADVRIPSPLNTPAAFSVTRARVLGEMDAEIWDALVPRDMPHLRYGFLRAVEDSRFGRSPHYLCAWREGRLAGVMVAYEMPVDLLTLTPGKYTRWVHSLRNRLTPRLLYLAALLCGPMVTNCNHNFFLASDLAAAEQQEAFAALLRELLAAPTARAFALFEFTQESAALFGPLLEAQGFLKAPSLPGTRLDVHWRSSEEYVASMRKAFRRTTLKDRRAARDIDFEIVDDFSAIAEEVWKLYANVLARAEHVFESLTPEFFRELGKFEQSRLVTARDRATGRLIGAELLLCGETLLQDLYTGLDYRYNEERRLYFNLLYPVIGYAGAQGFKTLYLGQTSYTFKARLGVKPYPLFLFVKHRNRLVHRLLTALRGVLFPETPTTAYKVFRDDAADAD